MNTRVVRSKFLRALNKRSIPHYPKRVSTDQIRDAIEAVKIWGVPLVVKTHSGDVYKIVDYEPYNLIDINGERIWSRDIVDYFLFPKPPVY